jgi:hypothetical protein
MNRINDFAGLQVAFPPAEADETKNTDGVKPGLYQPGVAFEPAPFSLVFKIQPASDTPTLMLPGPLDFQSIGVVSSPLTTESGHIPDQGPTGNTMPFLTQGPTNDCGPTSLAMVLNYYGIPDSRQDIDEAIHRGDNGVGGTPEDEMQYAEDRGLEAREYNNGTWEEVKSMIDQGYPVMASITGSSEPETGGDAGDTLPNGRHQIVITGYDKGPDGKEYVEFHDPNHNKLEKLSVDDFKKVWGKEDFGVKNFFMVFAPKGTNLPASRMDGAQGAMGTLNGAANLCNAFDRLFHPDNFGDWVHGIPELAGGLVQTVGCGVGALFQLGAEKLRGLVDGVPVLRNVVEPFTDIVSGFGGCVADVFNGWGKAFNDVGGAFDDLCHGRVADAVGDVGKAAGDVVKGVGNAIGDAASAVGNAVSDVFSGW